MGSTLIWRRLACVDVVLRSYALQRFVIGPAAHGEDRNILLVTLGLAVVIENALLYAFRADTRTVNLSYGFASWKSAPRS